MLRLLQILQLAQENSSSNIVFTWENCEDPGEVVPIEAYRVPRQFDAEAFIETCYITLDDLAIYEGVTAPFGDENELFVFSSSFTEAKSGLTPHFIYNEVLWVLTTTEVLEFYPALIRKLASKLNLPLL